VDSGQVNLSSKSRATWWRGGLLIVAVGAIFAAAFGRGCDNTSNEKMQTVKIGGKYFHLEVADNDDVRMKGLGQRDHIDPDGGMLFVFNQPHESAFVMRDCPIDIDIIYLDSYSKILKFYEMKAETPRTEAEKVLSPPYPDAPKAVWSNKAYEDRLKKYDSRFPMQFAIELKGGTIPGLNLKEGEKIDLPIEALKKRAK
jgi:uncharacterized membrane protein (UPF0127 family)